MQRGKRKVPCGGSSALCKGTRASPWPPGLHVQPLWALLLLPVWWEMPDPLRNQPKATLARVTQEPGVGKEGSCVPSRSAKCGEGGGWRDLQAPLEWKGSHLKSASMDTWTIKLLENLFYSFYSHLFSIGPRNFKQR